MFFGDGTDRQSVFLQPLDRTDHRECELLGDSRFGTTPPFFILPGHSLTCFGFLAEYLNLVLGHPGDHVGQKLSNAWDLCDMHGNVFEWCQDWIGDYGNEKLLIDPTGPASGKYRVLRGEAFDNQPRYVQSASRNGVLPVIRVNAVGFRLARNDNLSP